jgi:hypothetical protein
MLKWNIRIFVSLFLVIWTVSFSQSFEGKIIYSNSYKSKNTQYTYERWVSILGDTETFFIKGGDYRIVTNGSLMRWQLYINKDNKLYSKMANTETILWKDVSIQEDEVLSVKINKGSIRVLGYLCDEIILSCKGGVRRYYFSSKLGVDSKLFMNHRYGNWYDYLSKSNALPLKMVIENPEYIKFSTAISVVSMEVEGSDFELEDDAKLEKSRF